MSFTTLKTAIKTKLDSVAELQNAYDYHATDLTGFPCATFEPSGNENVIFTNTDNYRSYAFDLVIYQEFDKTTRQNAVNILAQAVDAVISAFDSDITLGGVCDLLTPLPSSWGVITDSGGSSLFAQIQIVCNVENLVTS